MKYIFLDREDFYNKLNVFNNLFNVAYFKNQNKKEHLLFMFYSSSKTELSFRKDILKLKDDEKTFRERFSHIPTNMAYEVSNRIKACNMEHFQHFYFLYEVPYQFKKSNEHYIVCAHGAKGYLGYKIQDNKLSELMIIAFDDAIAIKAICMVNYLKTKKTKIKQNPLRHSRYSIKFEKEHIVSAWTSIVFGYIKSAYDQDLREIYSQQEKDIVELFKQEFGEEKYEYYVNFSRFGIRLELSSFPDVLEKYEAIKEKYRQKMDQNSSDYENARGTLEWEI